MTDIDVLYREARELAEQLQDINAALKPFYAKQRALEHAIRTTYPLINGEDWAGNPVATVTQWSPATVRIELDNLNAKYAETRAERKDAQ